MAKTPQEYERSWMVNKGGNNRSPNIPKPNYKPAPLSNQNNIIYHELLGYINVKNIYQINLKTEPDEFFLDLAGTLDINGSRLAIPEKHIQEIEAIYSEIVEIMKTL